METRSKKFFSALEKGLRKIYIDNRFSLVIKKLIKS